MHMNPPDLLKSFEEMYTKGRDPYCCVSSKLLSAFCTSYPYFSRAVTASVRLNPIAASCLTGSTSSLTAGVASLDGTSRGGVRCSEAGGGGGGASCFFFLPNGRRIC